MYARYFGLRELPFNNTPDPRFFYSTPDHEEALATLIYAVEQRKGFVLLTGEIGAGKTLVSRLMLRKLGAGITFASVNHALAGARDLMESVCAEFELRTDKRASLTQLTRVLHDFLLTRFAQNIPVVLLLDEAQNLPTEAFEQLRMIGNLEADDAKLLQVVIVGQPELQATLGGAAGTTPRQLRQRIFRSFHLPAMNREATAGYVQHRLVVAGAEDPAIFTPDAIDRIFAISRGLPRVVNNTCDNAMLCAYSADRRIIDAPFVDHVADQMAAGPAPPQEPERITTRPRLVENPVATVPRERVGPAPHQSDRPATYETPVPDPRPVAAEAGRPGARDEGYPFHRKVLGQLRAATHRITALERGTHLTPELARDARVLVAELDPLVQRAESALARIGAACDRGKEREEKLQATEAAVKSIVRHLGELLTRCERATVGMRGEQARADATCRRLAEQQDRARELADDLGRVVEPAVSGRGSGGGTHFGPDGPGGMRQMLDNTADSLARLRILARQVNRHQRDAVPVSEPRSSERAAPAAKKGPNRAPSATNRLAHTVELLAEVAGSPPF